MTKSPSLIVTLVLATIMAVGLAVVTILYVLSRRQIAEARAILRLKDEQLIRQKEDQQLATIEEDRRRIAEQILDTEGQIQEIKGQLREKDLQADRFDAAITRVKSWNDLTITPPPSN